MGKRNKTAKDDNDDKTPLNVVFIHLDLGIGGAEQLVLQLATASQNLGHKVLIATTRCDDDHCFAPFSKSQNGKLADNVNIYGNWIPANLLGLATAFMSTLRMLYLTWQVCHRNRDADVIVVDVLPTGLPLLLTFLPTAASMFYCHFPDKLLLRTSGGIIKQLYRLYMDSLEEITMDFADLLVVNSKFTRDTVLKTFPNLPKDMPVLYPALDTSSLTGKLSDKTATSPIVSLNRFERKKNIELLLYSYQYLKEVHPKQALPPLIIAGGYDTKNTENVEYKAELEAIAEKIGIEVDFRTDISDTQRAELFQKALCVVYTPKNEHFGIVPLEAMNSGTPVVAVNSGGPMETIVDGKMGFLLQPKAQAFGDALLELIKDPSKASAMGRAGKHHVESTFGAKRLEREWQKMVQETIKKCNTSRPNSSLWGNVGIYVLDAIFAAIAVLAATVILQRTGMLGEDESFIGGLSRVWNGGEL